MGTSLLFRGIYQYVRLVLPGIRCFTVILRFGLRRRMTEMSGGGAESRVLIRYLLEADLLTPLRPTKDVHGIFWRGVSPVRASGG